jgi:hypothetical protein
VSAGSKRAATSRSTEADNPCKTLLCTAFGCAACASERPWCRVRQRDLRRVSHAASRRVHSASMAPREATAPWTRSGPCGRDIGLLVISAPVAARQFSSWNMGMYEMPRIAPSGDCSLATV